MRRTARLAPLLAIVSVAAPTHASAAAFRHGVAAGEVRATSAILWAQVTAPGRVGLVVARDARLRQIVARRRPLARAGRDLTVHATVGGLAPGQRYFYRFSRGAARSARGSFRTAPAASAGVPVRFALSGDADASRARGARRPFFNRFEVYGRMAAERNDFNVNVGDTIYSDSQVPGAGVATTAVQKWARYRQNLSLPALRALRGATGLYSHWDDHEFINDFSRPEHGEALYQAGVKAFRDYSPSSYSRRDGLYRSVRWGRHLELFFLDVRSFRDAKASAGGACDVAPGVPDLAPGAPQAARSAFAALIPPLAVPPPAECVARLADPRRSLLGERQFARFTAAVRRSTATFKVVVTPVPIQQFFALPYDRWEGYPVERRRLVAFLREHVRNVVFLATDTHANLVGDVRVETFTPTGPVDSGMTEVVTGPVATNTFGATLTRRIGSPTAARAIFGFFAAPPPRGLGMRCVAPDVFSYAQVEVTARTLRVQSKDARGRPVRQAGGAPCPPVVVTAR